MFTCNSELKKNTLYQVLAMATLLGPSFSHAENIALLVGINSYTAPNELAGAVNDVEAIKQVLQTKWHFDTRNIKTLLNKEATHSNILAELDTLKKRSSKGDNLFIYFSGHGTSANNTSLGLPLPSASGAFVPVDFPLDGKPQTEDSLKKTLIVGKWHLQPILKELEKDRFIFVAMDSCYSGNAVRAYGQSPFRKRYIALNLGDDAFSNQISVSATENSDKGAFDYPYKNVVFLSAASDAEQADDISGDNLSFSPTVDNKPHGAMTDALLRVLNGNVAADKNNDKQLSYNEIHQAVRSLVQEKHNHTPMLLPSLTDDTTSATDKIAFAAGAAAPITPVVASLPTTLTLHLQSTMPAVLSNLLQHPDINFGDNGEFIVSQNTTGFQLTTSAGDPILDKASLTDLKNRIASELWLRQRLQGLQPVASLNLQSNKPERGNNFFEQDTLAFRVKSSAKAYLIVLDISPNGALTMLYPNNPNGTEGQALAKDKLLTIPSDNPNNWIVVTPPFGMDQVIAFALPQKPQSWHELQPINNLLPQDTRVKTLEKILASQRDIAWQRLDIRTFAQPAQP